MLTEQEVIEYLKVFDCPICNKRLQILGDDINFNISMYCIDPEHQFTLGSTAADNVVLGSFDIIISYEKGKAVDLHISYITDEEIVFFVSNPPFGYKDLFEYKVENFIEALDYIKKTDIKLLINKLKIFENE